MGFGKKNPEDVLIKYLNALYSNNLKKTYRYMSKADRETISEKEFIKQNSLDDPFFRETSKTILKLSKFEVNETKIDGDRAIVNLTTIAPDMPRVLADIFGPFHGRKDMENPEEAMRYMLQQYLKKGDVPMTEDNRKFTLVKENGKWKIFLGFNKK